MVEVGIRELKSRLSYYVQLMQAGETVAIKVRNRVVGFLSKLRPDPLERKTKRPSPRDIQKLIAQWKQEGFLTSGGNYRPRLTPFKPIRFKGGKTASEIIREMRDEERW